MKGKLLPFALGVAAGSFLTFYAQKYMKKSDLNYLEKDHTTYLIKCPVLDRYGNRVSILYNNIRYDLFLKEIDISTDLYANIEIYTYNADLWKFNKVNDIPVVGFNKNTLQVEKVLLVKVISTTDTGLIISYLGKEYNILLNIMSNGKDLEFQNTVEALIVDGSDVFDILRIENIPVLDWEEEDIG